MRRGTLMKKISFRKSKKKSKSAKKEEETSCDSDTTVSINTASPVSTQETRDEQQPGDKVSEEQQPVPESSPAQSLGEASSSSSEEPKVHPDTTTTLQAAAALDDAGNALIQQGDYKGAMTSFTRALKLKRQSLNERSQEKARQSLSSRSLGSTSKETYSKEKDDNLLASMATSMNNIGYLRQKFGATPQETMQAYQDSLAIKKEILGSTHVSVGKTLNNIGSVYFSIHQYKSAMESYQEGLAIMQSSLGPRHLDVATVYSNIGDVFCAQSCQEEAHLQYKEALSIRWLYLEEHDPKVMRLLEKIAAIQMSQEFDFSEEEEDERLFSIEDGDDAPVELQLHTLHDEVKADIKKMCDLERQMALDMVRDKLRILKGMRDLDNMFGEHEAVHSTPTRPLTPKERQEALSSVKERLAQLRQRKEDEDDDDDDNDDDDSTCHATKLDF